MNKRIRELYNQSLVVQNDDAQWIESELDSEKFAELIVKECVICAEREWIRNGDTEHNRAVSKVIGSIKQHFGIAE